MGKGAKDWCCKLCGKRVSDQDTVLHHLRNACSHRSKAPKNPKWHPAVRVSDYNAYKALPPEHPDYLAPPPGTSRSGRTKKPKMATKPSRDKKDSLKKREAHDSEAPGNSVKMPVQIADAISPMRMPITAPTPAEFELPRGPVPVESIKIEGKQFYEITERTNYIKGYKFDICIADPNFPHLRYFRYTESKPHGAGFNYQDSSKSVLFDAKGTSVANLNGFCAVRANVGMQEGSHYWEIRVVRGIRPEDADLVPAPHVRIGIGRREASLENPVGMDIYSYGLRDVTCQTYHIARPTDFDPEKIDISQGDVIGFVLTLPSLELHRKVVAGTYNKAVDIADNLEPKSAAWPNIIRDRVKIGFKGYAMYEQFDYFPPKDFEPYGRNVQDPYPVPPNPNHERIALRTLPFSSLKVYRNGKYIGEAFTDLLAFLPPASKLHSKVTGPDRDEFNHGCLGYFPMVSVFYGSAVELNCGPDFRYPVPGLINEDGNPAASTTTSNKGKGKAVDGYIRPLYVRYNEQIAEDIAYDVVDEVDFWQQDGGATFEDEEAKEEELDDMMMIDPVLLAADAEAAGGNGGMSAGGVS